MNDPRIGTIQENKSRTWPELNIEGAPYTRPATTVNLDKTHFVVLPVNFEKKWPPEKIRAEFPSFNPPAVADETKPADAAPVTSKKASDGKS